MISHLLQKSSYILFFTLFYYFTFHQPLFVILLSLDNLFISYNTICHIYKLNYKNLFYESSYIDRYIYYFLILIAKPFIHLLLFTWYHHISYLLFMLACPPITNIILHYGLFIILFIK